MNRPLQLLAGAAVAGCLTAATANAETLFWSSQGKAVQESQAMREQVLKDFDGTVNFQGLDNGPWLARIQAEEKAGKGSIDLIGGLHGELTGLKDDVVDLSGVDLGDVKVNENYRKLGMLGTDQQKYLPWMQATYLMAANKKALEYLPEGAKLDSLTYDQLIAWAKNMAEKTGSPKFGFPAGPKGLKHRFFEGFLLPSYTGSMVTKFRSPEAVTAWTRFKELWQYTSPASTHYAFMQEPLLSGEVWVAFDHVARLADAFNQKPDDFVAFPAPSGPAGRGFMPVIAGVAIPKTAPDMDAARKLAAYMLRPETQLATLRATSFFPVTDVKIPDDMPPAIKAFGPAIAEMTGATDAIPALLPIGLGDLGGKFNQVYSDTFERIVLGGQPVQQALDDEAGTLRKLIEQAKAPCWAPDKPSDGACPVD